MSNRSNEPDLDKGLRINLERARVILLEAPAPSMDILFQTFLGFGVRQPIRCDDAEAALKLLETGDPVDLVVCDADAPQGKAYDFVMKLRSSPSEPNRYCPVVLVSGHTPVALVEKARDCGANFVVAKPLRPMVLLDRIVWVCLDKRMFVEVPGYVGPDRRFQFVGPPLGSPGRRNGDDASVGEATTPNLSQNEIDHFF